MKKNIDLKLVEILPEPYRKIIILRFEERLTLVQIANKINLSLDTVKRYSALATDLLSKFTLINEKIENSKSGHF